MDNIDRRAHDRLDEMEFHLKKHSNDIDEIRLSVNANTILTKAIETNTQEIVDILKGAKVAANFIVILAKLGVAIGSLYAVWHVFVNYLRGN